MEEGKRISWRPTIIIICIQFKKKLAKHQITMDRSFNIACLDCTIKIFWWILIMFMRTEYIVEMNFIWKYFILNLNVLWRNHYSLSIWIKINFHEKVNKYIQENMSTEVVFLCFWISSDRSKLKQGAIAFVPV